MKLVGAAHAFNPNTERQRQSDLRVCGQLGLHNETLSQNKVQEWTKTLWWLILSTRGELESLWKPSSGCMCDGVFRKGSSILAMGHTTLWAGVPDWITEEAASNQRLSLCFLPAGALRSMLLGPAAWPPHNDRLNPQMWTKINPWLSCFCQVFLTAVGTVTNMAPYFQRQINT